MFLTLFIGWFGIQIPSMHFIFWHYGFCTCCILLISGLETRSGECFCSARPDQAERSILPLAVMQQAVTYHLCREISQLFGIINLYLVFAIWLLFAPH